jgi:predicted metal-dependent peptidase
VVLDTSGSMDRVLPGKALGAIASYSQARDVPAARVVYCDAAAYDAGYIPVEDIGGRVQVRGRGGTLLQPGVDLLERAGTSRRTDRSCSSPTGTAMWCACGAIMPG